jgi:exodeoxyribonuclease V alpha subunit
MASIWGHVGRIIHRGEKFFVFSFEVDHADPDVSDKHITVSGHLYGLLQVMPGVPIQFVGDWIRHPKFGRQFSPYGWFPWATHDHGVERFLSECIDGFADMQIVEMLVRNFGTLLFDKLTDEPQQVLNLVPDDRASPQRMLLETAVLRWNEARALSNLSIFLQDYDMSEDVIRAVFQRFGTDAIEMISDNPYRLVAVDGFAFAKADKLAGRIGIGRLDPRRMDGAVLWILKKEAQQGHLSVRRGDFVHLLASLAQSEQVAGFEGDNLQAQLMAAVTRLEAANLVKVDPTVGVYQPDLYRFEREGAEKLAKFLTPSKIDVDLLTFLDDYERSNQIDLSDAQREAVQKLVESRVLALTGLPGTGKTTLIRAMVRLFKQAGMSFLLMAPTGIAAKRLGAVTGESAGTIHRMFGYDGQSWDFNGRNKYGVAAVIVDEMSMVDQELFYRVLDALHPETLLVLVGDDAQLPSVGPGNVLRELISSPKMPHVRLTQIFRQTEQSEIVLASHKINKGESPALDGKKEFQFVLITDEDRIVDFIVAAAVKLKARDANFQVLSPKYDGTIGVHNLNDQIRDKLNPLLGQKQWKAGKLNFREGDRVMVVRNDYKLNVYNGDMGKLISIDKDSLKVRVHGVGAGAVDTQIDIPKSQAVTMLRLAYAITVHKSQGSEFDTVLMPIVKSQGRMLQRNLFYTAITRAKKKVWLLGDNAAVFKAIGNDRVLQRNTVFSRAITEAMTALAGVGPLHDVRQAAGVPDRSAEAAARKSDD